MNKKEILLNEIWSGITHGIGLLLSIVAFVFLLIKAFNSDRILVISGSLIYGASLLMLFTSSTLFHCLYFTRAKKVFQALDHCSIFILIAGTYTPYCLLGIRGKTGLVILLLIWFLTISGILFHLLVHKKLQWIETTAYVFMGWLCLLGAKELLTSLGIKGFLLLVLGGLMFTLGALVYSIKGLKYTHVYWHVLVIFGAAFMFFSIYLYL
ncbi:PAQR family membrane homeostasis protein TrhA [Liquorilactobacillus satsumensis]|uniref:PAQR family membrane homeostasis protein TrhA n=1 Tax=Liquorilactobacillus satsumensis TaxID=259059 RepID=UPI0039EB835B